MIKYLGSKRKLIPHILDVVDSLPHAPRTALDAFTGTTRVAQALKQRGMFVRANDTASYAAAFARCYIEADRSQLDLTRLDRLIDELNELAGFDGYVTRTFSQKARFVQPHNARRIDAIRARIDELDTTTLETSILLTALVEAADRVDSTTGVQMAYLKSWAPRSFSDLALRRPPLLDGPGESSQLDALDFVSRVGASVDLAYLDPPYNQHSYRGNYHVWETLVRGDEPDAYGVAQKRVDCRHIKSPWNSKRAAEGAMRDLIDRIDARYILVSFNDEGHISPAVVSELLAARGGVRDIVIEHDRYVGARIGIHSTDGRKVGTVGRLRNSEHLLLVTCA